MVGATRVTSYLASVGGQVGAGSSPYSALDHPHSFYSPNAGLITAVHKWGRGTTHISQALVAYNNNLVDLSTFSHNFLSFTFQSFITDDIIPNSLELKFCIISQTSSG